MYGWRRAKELKGKTAKAKYERILEEQPLKDGEEIVGKKTSTQYS